MNDTPSSPCPRCQYELAPTLAQGGRRCPECGFRFTDRDLENLFGDADLAGAPSKLSPHETRLSGRWVLLGLAIFVALVATGMVLIFRAVGPK